MLGTHADAEDAVQETLVKWLRADRAAIASPAERLTGICPNLCVDMLRAAYLLREIFDMPYPNLARARGRIYIMRSPEKQARL